MLTFLMMSQVNSGKGFWRSTIFTACGSRDSGDVNKVLETLLRIGSNGQKLAELYTLTAETYVPKSRVMRDATFPDVCTR